MTNGTTYSASIEVNYNADRNAESTHKLITKVNYAPHGVICGDFKTLKMMGETFKRAGVYYLLPFCIN